MRFHSQNLNEDRQQNIIGSMFWRGRAWFYASRERHKEMLHVEWLFGKYARDFALTATFGYDDSNAGVCLHVCLPWLFSFYLVIPCVYRCTESEVGIAIHNQAVWLYTFTDCNESRSDYPWWKKSHSWSFPWDYKHHLTEILEHTTNLPGLAKTIWDDGKGKIDCRLGSKNFMRGYEEREAAQKSVSKTYNYTYTRKNGEVQHRQATVYVDRMTWRARWYPLIPLQKVRTSISITFSDEVGEKSGSWKGGCTGCGYDMLPGETPLETLRRMERERNF